MQKHQILERNFLFKTILVPPSELGKVYTDSPSKKQTKQLTSQSTELVPA